MKWASIHLCIAAGVGPSQPVEIIWTRRLSNQIPNGNDPAHMRDRPFMLSHDEDAKCSAQNTIGDGNCDQANNHPNCNADGSECCKFDGGDCCISQCTKECALSVSSDPRYSAHDPLLNKDMCMH